MKKAPWLWYALIAAAVLLPAGLRALTWEKPHSQPLDLQMVQAGKVLFEHEWTPNDPLCKGDGLGPVYNATSCAACHKDPGIGGSGTNEFNVTNFTVRTDPKSKDVREGTVHKIGEGAFQESLAHIAPGMPNLIDPSLNQLITVSSAGHCSTVPRFPQGVTVSQRNTPALWGARLIDELPESVIIANEKRQRLGWGLAPADTEDRPVGRAVRLANGKVGRFGWKAQANSLATFVQGACANELGLGNPGQKQPTPLSKPDYQPPALDLTQEQCDQMTAFCASLPRPIEKAPLEPIESREVALGKQLFSSVGCADCHVPNVGNIEGLYSDLLVHRMGQDLEGGGSYNDPPVPIPDGPPDRGPSAAEWRTPPLWGVAASGPYMHDGRAPKLQDAIRLHGGQGARSAKRFAELSAKDQENLIHFLETLRAPVEQ